MIITAPVTDYIPASILTTLNDIVVRGVAIPERVGNINWRGVHIVKGTRNTGGAQVIGSVGFTSKVIHFLCGDVTGSNNNWSVGIDNLVACGCIYNRSGGSIMGVHDTESLSIFIDASNRITGLLSAIGADGFTIEWTLTGAVTVEFIAACFA